MLTVTLVSIRIKFINAEIPIREYNKKNLIRGKLDLVFSFFSCQVVQTKNVMRVQEKY